MARPLRRWVTYLLTPIDSASLGVFRIVLGFIVAWDVVRYLQHGWVSEYYIVPKIHFTYLYLNFIEPWPGQWMLVHFWIMATLAVLVGLGLFYRVATVLLFLAYSYVFLLEQSAYMNHHYLTALLLFLLIWMPAHHAYSLDRRLRPGMPSDVSRWNVLILRFQLLVVYFYGGIAKLNPDWLAGEPMYSSILRGSPEVPEIASHVPPALLAYAIAYGGIVFDLVVPVLLVFPRTVAIGFAVAVVFHFLNDISQRLGVFSYIMTGAITIFFAPDWPRQLWRRLGFQPATAPALPSPRAAGPQRAMWLKLIVLHCYVLAQLVFPLRHWLYPGYVSWTEEGHRFSWHMKLRKKESLLVITVTDPATGRTWTLNPADDLRPRQLAKLQTFPDVLLQYVHYHRDQLHARGVADPIITGEWRCSLNGAPYQPLVDQTVNLAAAERSWRPAWWILPQQQNTIERR